MCTAATCAHCVIVRLSRCDEKETNYKVVITLNTLCLVDVILTVVSSPDHTIGGR